MRARIAIALRLTLVTIMLTGVVYPLVMTALSLLLFPHAARGSLAYGEAGAVVGSELIGQEFTSDRYFHPRPSANNYDGRASGPSNLGPTSTALVSAVASRVAETRERESLGPEDAVPADLVCTSASGLDPHISPESARIQATRIARARGLPVRDVIALIETHIERPTLGFIGDDRVNVLMLNVALDAMAGSAGEEMP